MKKLKKNSQKGESFHFGKGGERWFRVEFLRQIKQAQLTTLLLEDDPEK